MGKRELFIALAFVVVGVIAYQFTAPPAKEGEGFSLRQIWNELRAEIQEDAARGTITKTDVIRTTPVTTELRFVEAPRGLKVIGEDRPEIGYELTVESTGPTEQAAKELAGQVKLIVDDFGSSLTLRMDYPEAGRQTAQMVMRVPNQLTVRVQGRNVEVTNVANVSLEGTSGDSKILDVAGTVTGTHSGGELEIQRVGSAKLTLQNAQTRFQGLRDGATIDARGGELRITDSKGALELNCTNQEVTVRGHDGAVRIGGSGGRVELAQPTAESRVDMRRAEVDVTIAAAVPLMLLTTDEQLTVTIDGAPPIAIDAIATEGKVDAAAFSLTAIAGERGQELNHQFAATTNARVSIRNLRGDIVIGKMK